MFKILDKIVTGIIYVILFIPVTILQLIGYWLSLKNKDSFLDN